MGSSISDGYENKLDILAKVSLEQEKKLEEAFRYILINKNQLISGSNLTEKGTVPQVSSVRREYGWQYFEEKTDEQIEDEIQFHLEKIKDLKTVLGNKRKKYKKRNLKSLQGLKK